MRGILAAISVVMLLVGLSLIGYDAQPQVAADTVAVQAVADVEPAAIPAKDVPVEILVPSTPIKEVSSGCCPGGHCDMSAQRTVTRSVQSQSTVERTATNERTASSERGERRVVRAAAAPVRLLGRIFRGRR